MKIEEVKELLNHFSVFKVIDIILEEGRNNVSNPLKFALWKLTQILRDMIFGKRLNVTGIDHFELGSVKNSQQFPHFGSHFFSPVLLLQVWEDELTDEKGLQFCVQSSNKFQLKYFCKELQQSIYFGLIGLISSAQFQ